MSEDATMIGDARRQPTLQERREALIQRLNECLDELDALGLTYEANHVALGRDLLRERSGPCSRVLPEEANQPIPFRARERH